MKEKNVCVKYKRSEKRSIFTGLIYTLSRRSQTDNLNNTGGCGRVSVYKQQHLGSNSLL